MPVTAGGAGAWGRAAGAGGGGELDTAAAARGGGTGREPGWGGGGDCGEAVRTGVGCTGAAAGAAAGAVVVGVGTGAGSVMTGGGTVAGPEAAVGPATGGRGTAAGAAALEGPAGGLVTVSCRGESGRAAPCSSAVVVAAAPSAALSTVPDAPDPDASAFDVAGASGNSSWFGTPHVGHTQSRDLLSVPTGFWSTYSLASRRRSSFG